MRNLWLLLQRNAFALAFIALMGVSVSVLIRNNGAARSGWFQATGSVHARIADQRSQWSDYLHLAEQNEALARENAELRSQLLSMDLMARWEEDTLRGWDVLSGLLVQGPDGRPMTLCLAEPGALDGISPGMGVLASGAAFGTVEDVGPTHSRIITLLHGEAVWSCRLGRNGPVVSLGWDGVSTDVLQLQDVPRHVVAEPGDSIFTSGFDLRLPGEVLMGTVIGTERRSGADFVTVTVRPAVDFRAVRHLEFIRNEADSERVVLSSPTPNP